MAGQEGCIHAGQQLAGIVQRTDVPHVAIIVKVGCQHQRLFDAG